MKKPFLVTYEYGQGAVWAFVLADTQEEIGREFHELTVVDRPPGWMSLLELRKLEREMTFDLEERRQGLLADILEARREGRGFSVSHDQTAGK